MKILVTGATGLIGRNLSRSLSGAGHRVIGLSRAPEKAREVATAEMLKWDPFSGPPPAEALKDVEAVVHLAGEPIAAHRWTDEQKRRIRASRVISTRNLVEGMRAAKTSPAVFVAGSAVGFYGDTGDNAVDESAPAGEGFLSEICREWEDEAVAARDLSIRVVLVRTGVVLSADDGALKKMLPAFKLGVAGPLASGRQWFPWIHIDDIVGIFEHAIFNDSMSGPVNAAAPESVTNAEFTRQLARVLHRPAFLPAPEFALRLMMGEMADVLLASQRVIPRAALDAGYSFKHPLLAEALEDLLGSREAGSAGEGRSAAGSAR
jgi:uncharacterized protein (TIGR01777 family)